MRSTVILIIGLFFCANVWAADSAPVTPDPVVTHCTKQSLIHFVSHGQEVPSQVIGSDDGQCDGFGGNLVYTPEYHVYVYVNFNISGTVDLDMIDASFAKAPQADSVLQDRVKKLEIAFVNKDWIRREYKSENSLILNLSHTILFVSEAFLAPDSNFSETLDFLYESAASW